MKRSVSRLLSILLALCLALALLPGTALAVDIAYPVIGGSIHFDPATGTVTGCDISATEAVIPGKISGISVTAIGAHAFYLCESLTSVTISDGVASIGELAFAGCESLTGVTIPASVTSIGEGAFYRCVNLTGVAIPAGVTSIEAGVFHQCSALSSVSIPTSVTSIGYAAFSGCASLADVYYDGGRSQWGQVWINRIWNGNAALTGARIHCLADGGNDVFVTVNGVGVEWADAGPFIDWSGRAMVPLRPVADAMGLEVIWNGEERAATFTDGNRAIRFTIDSHIAGTDRGYPVYMDTAAVIINDRSYAPVRYLAEYFGYSVYWDGAVRTVVIV